MVGHLADVKVGLMADLKASQMVGPKVSLMALLTAGLTDHQTADK